MKTCRVCAESKPLDEFYTHPRMADGHLGQCKTCHIAFKKARDVADPEASARKRAKWSRDARLRQYGITQDDYEALFAEQAGKCAICGASEAGGWGGMLPVDHDHETGAVRGLLCHNCNGGLGQFGDDPDRLIAAAMYLLARQNVLGRF